jgi:O-antigen/teichoic acid export membrane protein/2-polyprenyl-3-methyl-5-hydroxy-6-metoxy-1,4-benzoquinol methylase
MISPAAIPQNVQEDVRLPRAPGKFISNVLTLVTGNGLSQLINLAGTLVLARLVAPEAFGSFALFVTLVSFLSVLGGGRYELAIMLPEKDEEAGNILSLAVIVLTGVTGVALLLVALFHVPAAQLLGDARLRLWLWAVPLALFVNGLYQVQGVWFGRMKRFQGVATARVIQSLGTVVGQLALLAFHSGGFALVGGWVIGQSLGSFCLLSQLLHRDGGFLRRTRNWAVVRNAVGKYKNFPLYKAPHSFVSNAASQLVLVILRMFADLNLVGLYSMSARAVYLPVTLISSSMNDVFYEKAATELKTGGLERFVTRLLRIQLVLAAPVLVLFAFDAKLIFGFILGPKWVEAGTYAAILAFVSFLYFLTSWLDRLFDVRGRQKICLALEISGNAVALGSLALSLKWRPHDAPLAIGLYVALQIVFGIVWLIFAYRVAEFSMRGLTLLLRDAVVSIGLSTIFVGAVNHFLSGWPAFLVSTAIVMCMIAVSFVRYVSTGSALSSTTERFRQFWADKGTTLKGRDDEQFRRAHGAEVKGLLPARVTGRVLEVGCGDGGLFPYLGVPAENYKGIDFSPQFLRRFQAGYPSVQLECTEGASYLDRNTQYDVILSDGIVQHFDRAMLEQHLRNARDMMSEDGQLIWASIPQRKHRRRYDAGNWSTGGKSSPTRLLKSWAGRLLGMDAMGYWYEPTEIAALAVKYGFHARFVSSHLHPYRFHAVLRKKCDQPEKQEDRNFHSPAMT